MFAPIYLVILHIYTNRFLVYNFYKIDVVYPSYKLVKVGEQMPEESKISKAQQKAVNKYVKNNYDRINVTFPKGQKEIIKDHAKRHGESVNSFIVGSVNERMEREQ